MVGLRPDDQVDGRGPADDFLAFGLRHAAGDADHDVAAGRARGVLHGRIRPSSE